MKIDRRKLWHAWNSLVLTATTFVGFLALTLPEYRGELGKWGGWVLLGVKCVDFLLNRRPKLPKAPE